MDLTKAYHQCFHSFEKSLSYSRLFWVKRGIVFKTVWIVQFIEIAHKNPESKQI